MKRILHDRIVQIPDTSYDDRYVFTVVEGRGDRIVDLRDRYGARADRTAVSRRWDDVLPASVELDVFREAYDEAIRSGRSTHIEPVSLRDTVELVRDLYQSLGYYDASLNTYIPDLARCPVSIGIDIHNLVYSYKDGKRLGGSDHLPPIREPRHQKALSQGINAGIIATLRLTGEDREDVQLLRELLLSEKISLLRLGQVLGGAYAQMGVAGDTRDIIVDLA